MTERKYAVWACINDNKHMRPLGRKMTEACDRKQVIGTKKRDGSRLDCFQGKCKECGRRRRLNPCKLIPNERHDIWFDTRDEAERHLLEILGNIAENEEYRLYWRHVNVLGWGGWINE